jgi:ribonuclease E
VLESSTEKCPYCGGSGHVRSVSSLALQVLRALEEQLIKGATHNLIVRTRPDVALYVLNQKRAHLRSLEERFVITITISADESVRAPQAFIIDRGEQVHTAEAAKAIAERPQALPAPLEEEDDLEDFGATEGEEEIEALEPEAAPAGLPEQMAPEQQDEGGPPRRRRRRRRGGRNGGEGVHGQPREAQYEQPHQRHDQAAIGATEGDSPAAADQEPLTEDEGVEQTGEFGAQEPAGESRRDGERRRRRGRRGGRRNRHRNGEAVHANGDTAHGGDDREPSAPPQEFVPAEGLIEPAPAEPDLKAAVADLDAPPRPAAPAATRAEAPEQPLHPPEEPARRRSTVRERAPISAADEGLPPPQTQQPVSATPEPVITEIGEVAESDRPRRTGWWSRRFAGG